jgi:hypothetical protein
LCRQPLQTQPVMCLREGKHTIWECGRWNLPPSSEIAQLSHGSFCRHSHWRPTTLRIHNCQKRDYMFRDPHRCCLRTVSRNISRVWQLGILGFVCRTCCNARRSQGLLSRVMLAFDIRIDCGNGGSRGVLDDNDGCDD